MHSIVSPSRYIAGSFCREESGLPPAAGRSSARPAVWRCSGGSTDGRGYENSLKLIALVTRAAWCKPGIFYNVSVV